MKLYLPNPALLLLVSVLAVGCEAGGIDGDSGSGPVDPGAGEGKQDGPAELPKAQLPDVIHGGCSEDLECAQPGEKLETCLRSYCDLITGLCAIGDAIEGKPCEDGEVCSVDDYCQGGVCRAGPTDGCDDDNACTYDTCEVTVGCVHEALDGFCDDDDSCTIKDLCQDGVCAGTEPLDCGDQDPCTEDSCEVGIGCVHVAFDGACDDENLCTEGDVCSGGQCLGTAVACADAHGCTDDVCDPIVGCAFIPQDALCDDGDPCTQNLCDLGLGCVAKALTDGTGCDDSNACTESDACLAGSCVGTQVLCTSQDPCMDAVCDFTTGCVTLPNASFCDDGDPCTTGDVCSGGVCTGVDDPWCGQGGCGDGLCDAGLAENCSSCPADCGDCGVGGGGGACGADLTFTCSGSCGGSSGLGCYCDSLCEDYGDCCPDKVACCGGGGGSGGGCGANPFDTCSGVCGTYDTFASCQCDAACDSAGDCCSDKALCCDAGGGGGNDSCVWAFDNFCDEPFLCAAGTDCTDCGTCW